MSLMPELRPDLLPKLRPDLLPAPLPDRPPALLRRAGGLLALGLAACATPPALHLHSLMPDPAAAVAPAPSPPLTIQLGPVMVPAQVDQPQWLVRLPDGTLALLDNERWASPLRDELRAALRETLARRWGVQDAAGAVAATPAWRVNLELLRLDSSPGRETRIDAQWALSGVPMVAGQPTLGCRATLRQTVGAGSVALADGHRRLVARLADQIGRQLRALNRGEAPPCEADE